MGSALAIPTILEPTGDGERALDLYSKLLESRIVFLSGTIDEASAKLVVAQLLHLEALDQERDISLYVNSPGGDMNALFALYDTMRFIRPDVATVCFGQAASAAAVVLAAGAPGKRHALPHARILIHQPHGGAEGQSVDIEIWAREIAAQRDQMVEILALHCEQTVEKIRDDIDRDFILRGAAAVDYGIVDKIVTDRAAAGHPTA
ncbi:MAG: ATP-dependent Clp protease proteolytic subunit [Acidimicrobiia bacterium]